MLCNKCIGKLAINLSPEAGKIVSALMLGAKSQNEIILATKLSYAVVYRALKELTGSSFVGYKEKGRSKQYDLTNSGKMLVSLCKREAKN